MTVVRLFIGLPSLSDSAKELGVGRNIMRRASVNAAFLDASREMLAYQRRRYVRLSAGGGSWLPLSDETVKIKTRKKHGPHTNADGSPSSFYYKISAEPHWIMRENDEILNAIEVQRARGGVSGFHVGILRDRSHDHSNLTTGQLAALHGDPESGKWPIVGQPPSTILSRIEKPIIDAINKELKIDGDKEPKPKAPPPPAPRSFIGRMIRRFRGR